MDEQGNIIIYQSEDGVVRLDVRLADNTVWLTQQQMAELYRSSRTNVVEHIKHIYEEGELQENATCRKFRQVRQLDNNIVSIGEELLTDGGSVSHEESMEKAVTEYRKYQVKTLSSVEQAYLESIKGIEKRVKRSRKKE